MIPVRELASAAEVLANARAVKGRLWGLPKQPVITLRATAEKAKKAKKADKHAMRQKAIADAIEQQRIYDELHLAATLIARGFREGATGIPYVSPEIDKPRYVKMREVTRFVVAASPFDLESILSHRRDTYLVRYRHVLAWSLMIFSGQSMSQIGRSLGNRDHTTILYIYRKIEGVRKAAGIEIDRNNWMATINALLEATEKGRGRE